MIRIFLIASFICTYASLLSQNHLVLHTDFSLMYKDAINPIETGYGAQLLYQREIGEGFNLLGGVQLLYDKSNARSSSNYNRLEDNTIVDGFLEGKAKMRFMGISLGVGYRISRFQLDILYSYGSSSSRTMADYRIFIEETNETILQESIKVNFETIPMFIGMLRLSYFHPVTDHFDIGISLVGNEMTTGARNIKDIENYNPPAGFEMDLDNYYNRSKNFEERFVYLGIGVKYRM